MVIYVSECSHLHSLIRYMSDDSNNIDRLLKEPFRRNSLELIGVFNELN